MQKHLLRFVARMLVIVMIFSSFSELGINAYAYDADEEVALSYTSVSSNEAVVTFDVNGGKDIYAKSIIVEFNKSLKDNGYSLLPETSRDGFEFLGWFAEDGKEFTVDSLISKDITVKAKWKELLDLKYHNIEYVLDGGTSYGVNGFTENEEVVLAKPEKPGYVFEGWYLDKNFTEKSKIVKISKGTTKDVTVYAKWKAYTYTVVFDGGDGAKGTMKNQIFTFDKTEPIRKNLFKKQGYTFKCWSVSNNMIQRYIDSESVNNIIVPEYDGQNITLVAIWVKDENAEYFVKYYNVLNGNVLPFTEREKGKYAVKESYKVNTLLALPKNIKREGYKFGGWYTDKNCKYAVNLSEDTNKNLKLYAKWIPWTYKIVFQKNGGKGTMETMTVRYGEDAVISKNRFIRKGYEFQGWALSKDLAKKGSVIANTGTSVKDYIEANIYKNNQKFKLCAIWSPNIYKISYVTGVGSVVNALETYEAGSKYNVNDIKNKTTLGNLPSFVTLENNFKGWYLTPGYKKKGSITKKTTGDVTMYAKWKFNYTVTYDKNYAGDSENLMPDKVYPYSSKKALTKNKYTRSGYGFLGWAVVSGNGCSVKTGVSANAVTADDVIFGNKQKITNFDMNYFTVENGQPVLHLVAVWGKRGQIVLDVNGGSLKEQKGVSFNGTDYIYTYDLGANITNDQLNSIHIPVKHSYNFAGWYLDPEYTKPALIDSETTGNTVFYAKWEGISYSIKYVANDAAGTSSSFSYTYGVADKLKGDIFTRTGYSFLGWSTKPNGEVEFEANQDILFIKQAAAANYMDENSISSLFTLYAVWAPEYYEAIFFDVDFGDTYVYKYTVDMGLDLNVVAKDIQSLYPKTEYELKPIYADENMTKLAASIPKGQKGSSTPAVFYVGWMFERN